MGFGSRTRRAVVGGMAASLVAAGFVVASIAPAHASTNGQAVTWAGTTCRTSANGITKMLDVTLQASVEDAVATGASYGAVIPAGNATLPDNATGLTIKGYTNLRNTYVFSPSAGSVQITDAQTNPLNAPAVNNGANKTFNVSYSNAGTSLPITSATYASTGGGQITFTTSTPHGFVAGQPITTSGSSPAGYNFDAYPITSVTATTFTLTQTGSDPGAFVSGGTANTLTAMTTTIPGGLLPGTLATPEVDVTLTAPAVDATVTTYTPAITTTANVVNFGLVTTLCPLPHSNPQSDGISSTLVGSGGPTTTSQPACRDVMPGRCATILPVPCGMGAGVADPPKAPKNAGLVKISKGLAATAAPKATKWTFTGTVENCTNQPSALKTHTPISGGTLQLQVTIPAGSTCSNLIPGAPVKVSLQVKWTSMIGGKAKVVDTTKFTSLSAYARVGTGAPVTLDVTTHSLSNTKSAFNDRYLVLHFVMDETQSALDTACGTSKGISVLHFTGAAGASTLTGIYTGP